MSRASWRMGCGTGGRGVESADRAEAPERSSCGLHSLGKHGGVRPRTRLPSPDRSTASSSASPHSAPSACAHPRSQAQATPPNPGRFTNRARPGLREALAAVRKGDTLIVTKLDRLAQFHSDARHIADELTRKGASLSLSAAASMTRPALSVTYSSTCSGWWRSSKRT